MQTNPWENDETPMTDDERERLDADMAQWEASENDRWAQCKDEDYYRRRFE